MWWNDWLFIILSALTDHKVAPYTEDELKDLARKARAFFEVPEVGYFNVIDCIRALAGNKPFKGERLQISFFNRKGKQAPAKIQYKPLRLSFDKEYWDLADIGEPAARYVGAHEICHVLVHNSDAQQYSGQIKKWIDFREQSAEWQANTFADHFLVSDASIDKYFLPGRVAAFCGVENKVAIRRVGNRVTLVGNYCPECGNSSLYRVGLVECCDVCNWSVSL